MYKGVITANTAVAANTNVPFVTVFNTNDNTGSTSAGVVDIKKAGYYDVVANVRVTGVASSPITAQLYANGVAVPEAIATAEITATTGIATLTIVDVLRVVRSDTGIANISVRLAGAATVTNAVLTVEKRK